jgi:hypothetical protein
VLTWLRRVGRNIRSWIAMVCASGPRTNIINLRISDFDLMKYGERAIAPDLILCHAKTYFLAPNMYLRIEYMIRADEHCFWSGKQIRHSCLSRNALIGSSGYTGTFLFLRLSKYLPSSQAAGNPRRAISLCHEVQPHQHIDVVLVSTETTAAADHYDKGH